MSHLLMGAINKTTNQYEYPRMALKTNTYSCPDCKKDVIPRKGDIRVHHFAHYKSENPCIYYERPGESQIHKDAKMALKTILEQDKNIFFIRKCRSCIHADTHDIEKRTEESTIHLEHRFTFNDSRKIADVACLNGTTIKYIFEICYKHKTREDIRPEPWFEIDAVKLLEDINSERFQGDNLELKCIREHSCKKCILKEIEEKEKERLREIEEKEKERLREIEEKEKRRLEIIELQEKERIWQLKILEEKEKERLRLIKEKEKQRLREIQEEKYRKLLELKNTTGAEIKKRIWSEHKKCIKCKSYERCKKCVKTLWTKYNTEFKKTIDEQSTTPQASEAPLNHPESNT